MITLQIAGASPAEVAAQVKGFFEQLVVSQGLTLTRTPEPQTPPTAPQQTVEATATEVKEPKAERKPRKKAEEPKEQPKQVDLEEAIAEKADKAPPIDDVRSALMKLSKAKGDDAVWNMLEKYMAKSASTVPEERRAKLIAEIEKECA